MAPNSAVPVVLCVAGFDPSGGGGLLADARAVQGGGAFAACAQTALVPQNTRGVCQIAPTSPELLRAQIELLHEDYAIRAVKIGLVPTVEAAQIIAEFLDALRVPVVLDPVLAPTNGPIFSDDATTRAISEWLLPRATLVMPNAIEAEILSGLDVKTRSQMMTAARELRQRSGANVLIKGGHLPATSEVFDLLFASEREIWLSAPRDEGGEVRGTGCLLASAIAARLARGLELEIAVREAHSWLQKEIGKAQKLGGGRRVSI